MLECAVRMTIHNFFFNKEGQLRSGWRVTLFVIAFLVSARIIGAAFRLATAAALGAEARNILRGNGQYVIAALVLFSSATLVGWGCAVFLERLSFRSVGWWPHRGWVKNLVLGSALGAASMLLAVGLATVSRGITFTFNASGAGAIGKTAIVSAIIFILAGSAEEALFRGYPLQTLTRARLAWLGILLTSVPFALVHLNNPNAPRAFAFVNTSLAGVWLAVAYLRTRSLWFPMGLHWSWNWTQAVLGIPVSGIERIGPAPLLHASNAGPDWLTGGAYGIEGGAACTVVLLISTVVVWRTKLVAKADDDAGTPSQVVNAPSDHAAQGANQQSGMLPIKSVE